MRRLYQNTNLQSLISNLKIPIWGMCLLLFMAACQPTATPVAPTVNAPPTGTPVPPIDLTPAQLGAMSALSNTLTLPLDRIAVVSAEAVTWSNGCLDLIQVGLACTEAVVQGFRIVLEVDRLKYEYHTDASGNQVKGATLGLSWHQATAQGCGDLLIYLSGEVYGRDCRAVDGSSGAFPAARLTTDEARQLSVWALTFSPAIVQTDSVLLSLYSAGGRQPTDTERQALLSWAQAIFDRLKPCC